MRYYNMMKGYLYFIIFDALLVATIVKCQNITYKVVSNTLPGGSQMGVIIDNNVAPFILSAPSETPYIFIGSAPTASIGYKYTIITNNNVIQESEPFMRAPVQQQKDTTLNEVYNRSINTYSLPSFPQLYPLLPSIHRIDTKLHQDDQIPAYFFYGNEAEIANMHTHVLNNTINVELNLTYIGLNQVKALSGVTMKIAGRGTRYSSKASYKIKLDKQDDLFGYRRIKFRSSVTDPSYLREKIAYDLMRSFGLASSGYSFARVFINNKSYGLFGVQEDFENPWLLNEFNNGVKDNYSQGILYNGNIDAPLSYLGDNLTLYNQTGDNIFHEANYVIKENPSKGQAPSFDQLMAFTKFLANAPTTESNAVSVWNQHIDTDSVIRSLALEIIVGNTDGYITGPANYYLYSDSNKHGRLVYLPSDMDLTLGSTIICDVHDTIQKSYESFPGFNETRPLLHTILKVPEFKATFEDIMKKTIGQQINNVDFLYNRINALSILIKEDATWDRTILRDYVVVPDLLQNNMTAQTIINNNVPVSDYLERIKDRKITFEEAVNGTLNRPSIMGLKEWISKSTSAYLQVNPPIVSSTIQQRTTTNNAFSSLVYNDRTMFSYIIAIIILVNIITFDLTLII